MKRFGKDVCAVETRKVTRHPVLLCSKTWTQVKSLAFSWTDVPFGEFASRENRCPRLPLYECRVCVRGAVLPTRPSEIPAFL